MLSAFAQVWINDCEMFGEKQSDRISANVRLQITTQQQNRLAVSAEFHRHPSERDCQIAHSGGSTKMLFLPTLKNRPVGNSSTIFFEPPAVG